jgi:hypothetical protein
MKLPAWANNHWLNVCSAASTASVFLVTGPHTLISIQQYVDLAWHQPFSMYTLYFVPPPALPSQPPVPLTCT